MIEAFTTGSLHTNKIAITTEIESGFVAKDNLVPFCYSRVSLCAAPLQTEASIGWASKAVHVMDAVIPNVQPDAFVWFENTQWPLVTVRPVPGWRPMKQLAVHVPFLRCGGLLDDWSVEGVVILVFM
ncbi:uncharacterized protein TNCV_802041 [Trichonephila clavipes]|nr:uncharacterized protein TNCV_802041 [Trichonephila clavipes]